MGGAIASLLTIGACSNDEKDEPQGEEYDEAYYAAAATLSSESENFQSTDEGYALSFSAEGGEITISVDCGCAWTAEAAEDYDWLSFETAESSITITASASTESTEAGTSSTEDADEEDADEEDADEESGEEPAETSARAAEITLYTSESHIEIAPIAITQTLGASEEEGNEPENNEPEGDDSFSLIAKYSTDSGASYSDCEISSTKPDDISATSGASTPEEILEEYDCTLAGYIPYEAGRTYLASISPLGSAADAQWDDSWDSGWEAEEYEDICEFSGASYDGENFGATLYALDDIPDRVDFFYIAFHPYAEDGETVDEDTTLGILFFYKTADSSEGDEGNGGGDGDSYSLIAKYSADSGASYSDCEISSTKPDDIFATSGASTPEEILEEYNCTLAGYIPYEKGHTYCASISPLGSANDAEVYDSWDSGWDTDDYENICSYEGGAYDDENFAEYLYCDGDLNERVDFVYIAFKATSDDEDALGILFFYRTAATESNEPEADAEISLSTNSLSISADGSTQNITVTANYDWTATTEASWITLTPNLFNNTLTITVAENDNTESRSADITISCAGTDEGNTASATLSIYQDAGVAPAWNSDDLVFEYTLTAGIEINLPLAGTVNCNIDWGDGTTTEGNTSTYPTHTYSAAGTYYVSVSSAEEGTAAVTWLNYSNSTATELGRDNLTALKSWGKDGTTAFTSMQNSFRDCTALVSLPDEAGPFSKVTTYTYAFYGCTALTSIPAALFENIDPSCETWTYMFEGDTALLAIPEGLFDALTDNVQYNFNYCFSGCTALTTVPTSLFDNQKAAIKLNSLFNGCCNWEGESPYTISTDGETHIHLYDRGNHTDEGFNAISGTYSKKVFTECTKLTDYDAAYNAGWAAAN